VIYYVCQNLLPRCWFVLWLRCWWWLVWLLCPLRCCCYLCCYVVVVTLLFIVVVALIVAVVLLPWVGPLPDSYALRRTDLHCAFISPFLRAAWDVPAACALRFALLILRSFDCRITWVGLFWIAVVPVPFDLRLLVCVYLPVAIAVVTDYVRAVTHATRLPHTLFTLYVTFSYVARSLPVGWFVVHTTLIWSRTFTRSRPVGSPLDLICYPTCVLPDWVRVLIFCWCCCYAFTLICSFLWLPRVAAFGGAFWLRCCHVCVIWFPRDSRLHCRYYRLTRLFTFAVAHALIDLRCAFATFYGWIRSSPIALLRCYVDWSLFRFTRLRSCGCADLHVCGGCHHGWLPVVTFTLHRFALRVAIWWIALPLRCVTIFARYVTATFHPLLLFVGGDARGVRCYDWLLRWLNVTPLHALLFTLRCVVVNVGG